ncbi:hypothetical protein AJ78_07992 [Emergomyces pasteurianus Ep9510]|uniref:Uncharacterized protein n=1 Tax=Emergomyces pasteurianus Ep9510 TaxID=1447872 RepID=A0A1J9P498_9EURO|nr:hypothetical protein AJ78_07992 [Emergomyces pasteurianus Ep9510]
MGGGSSGEDRTEGWRPAGVYGREGWLEAIGGGWRSLCRATIRRMGRVRRATQKEADDREEPFLVALKEKDRGRGSDQNASGREQARARRLIVGPTHEITCARWLGRGGWGGGPWMERDALERPKMAQKQAQSSRPGAERN